MKNTLYLVLIFIVLVLGYFKYQEWQHPTPIITSPSPSPEVESSSLVRSLSTPYFSLEYPVEATSSPVSESPDSDLWQVSYMGDKQRASDSTQTELFDGYAISLTRFTVVGENIEQTQAEADRKGIVDACGEENATVISSIQIVGKEALTFFGGCLGEGNHYYFMENDNLYRLTTLVVGEEDDKQIYQSTVDKIFSSLKFTE